MQKEKENMQLKMSKPLHSATGKLPAELIVTYNQFKARLDLQQLNEMTITGSYPN